MLLSKQPGDTGVFATATSTRIVVYDLQHMSAADFFSTAWYHSTLGGDHTHVAGKPTSPSSALALSTQALHVRSAARLAARPPANSMPFHSLVDYTGGHASGGPPSFHDTAPGGSEAAMSGGGGDGSRSFGRDKTLEATAGFVYASQIWGPALPPCLVVDLSANHRGVHAMPAPGDVSFAGSAKATTAAGHVPSSLRPPSGAEESAGAVHARRSATHVHGVRAPPPPSSVTSQEMPLGTNKRSVREAGAGPHQRQSLPPVSGQSLYTGSVVNNSFRSMSGNSASGGVLSDPVSLSLSCSVPHFQFFMSDRSGAAWIGTSTSTTVTRIHAHPHGGRTRQNQRSRPGAGLQQVPPLTGARSHVDMSVPLHRAAPRRDRGGGAESSALDGLYDEDPAADEEDDDEEEDNTGDATTATAGRDGEADTTGGGSSSFDVTTKHVRRGVATAFFPSRVTTSGWDPRSGTTLALGRHDGVVQLLDVEYLVGSQRYTHAGAGGGNADFVTGASGTYRSDDDDEECDDDAAEQETDLIAGRGPLATAHASASSHNNNHAQHPNTTDRVIRPPRRGRRPNNSHTKVHQQHAYFSFASAGSAARIEYSTVQQCLLEGPVTALDWIPLSHSAVVASRRQSGLGYSVRVLDLRTPDKSLAFGGDGDTLCCAEKLACDPSQRFVATVASESQYDVVQLWDVRLTTKPLTYARYPCVGYTSLCWTGSARDWVRGGGSRGGGRGVTDSNAVTLLGVTRRGRVRLHDFTEDSNGFPLANDMRALPEPVSWPAQRPRRPTHALTYTRCSLDEDRDEVNSSSNNNASSPLFAAPHTLNTAHAEANSTQLRGDGVGAATAALSSPAQTVSGATLAGPEAQPRAAALSASARPPIPSNRIDGDAGKRSSLGGSSLARADHYPDADSAKRGRARRPARAALALRLPVRLPTSAVAWIAPPLPAHPTANDDGDADGTLTTSCTRDRLVGRASRVDLPFTLLLNEQNGEVYAQVYNRYGSVAAIASVDNHVFAAAGPNLFWTNVARLRKRGPLPVSASASLSTWRGGAHEPHGRIQNQNQSQNKGHASHDVGNAVTTAMVAEMRVEQALTRAQRGLSADPVRNLAVLLEEGVDKEAFILFRYGVVLARHLFPASPAGEDGGERATAVSESAANRTAPLPPVPVGQYVPGILELLKAEWHQRAYLGVLDVPLPLRPDTATSGRRAARPRNGEDDDTADDGDSDDEDSLSADTEEEETYESDDETYDTSGDESESEEPEDDHDVDGGDEIDVDEAEVSGSRRASLQNSQLTSRVKRQTASRSASGFKKAPKRKGTGRVREKDARSRGMGESDPARTHKRKQRKTQARARDLATHNGSDSPTPTSSNAAATWVNRRVTLPDLHLFRGRPMAVTLPGMFLAGSLTGATSMSTRDALMGSGLGFGADGGNGSYRLFRAALRGRASPAAMHAGPGAGTSPTAVQPPPSLAALGALRGLLLAGLGWRCSATEVASARAASQALKASKSAAAAHTRGTNHHRTNDGYDVNLCSDDAPTASTAALQSAEEVQRVGKYFVDGDGIGAHNLQEAVERRVAVLVLQDRLREASEVVAHYSDSHPLYPTLALEISAAGMATASPAAAVAPDVGAGDAAASSSSTRDSHHAPHRSRSGEESKWERRLEMEQRLQYMHQRTTGCTFWMSLALTYIDMIVRQRPTGVPASGAQAQHANSKRMTRASGAGAAASHGPSVSPASSPRPPLRKAPTVGPSSSTQSPPLSRPLSPLDAALPFAALQPRSSLAAEPVASESDATQLAGPTHRNPPSRHGGPTTTTAIDGSSDEGTAPNADAAAPTAGGSQPPQTHAAEAVAFYGVHTPHVGLSHLAFSAQPAFFLKLLARFPDVPVSDQLGMAVALLLPPRYTSAHMQNLRDVLHTLSVRQYNLAFRTDCALLDAAGGGAAVIASMHHDRPDRSAPSSRAASGTHAAHPHPHERTHNDDPEPGVRRGRNPTVSVASGGAILSDGDEAAVSVGASASSSLSLPRPQRRPSPPVGDGLRVPLPPLHPRASSITSARGQETAGIAVATTSSGNAHGNDGGSGGESLFRGEWDASVSSLSDAARRPASESVRGAGVGAPGGYASSPPSKPTAADGMSQTPTAPTPAARGTVPGGSQLLLAAVVEGMRGSLQRYVDMTGDVQIPLCYTTAFGPTRTASYRQWREAYRGLLNEAGSYLLRSQHDLACVKVLRSRGGARPAVHDAFHVPRPGFAVSPGAEGGAVAAAHRFDSLLLGGHICMSGQPSAPQGPAEFETPHRAVELRCNCGQAMHATAPIKATASAATPKAQIQQIPCGNPECRQRQTPMCTVCGERLEHKSTELSPDRSFTWCTTCLHGGHWCHLREWFTKHKKCPVEDCLCECGGSPSW